MNSLQEQVIADISEATFFKELCFTGQTFSTTAGASKELADVLVWLETEALIVQVKERDDSGASEAADIAKWFRRKVIGKGADQIADTIGFLSDHEDVVVKNARGREFALRELNVEPRHNVIVYGSLSNPTALREQVRAHHSRRSGLIHLIEAVDFRNLLRLTVTPRELCDYLVFRGKYLAQHEFAGTMSEKWLLGRFVHTTEPTHREADVETWDGEAVVESLTDDASEIDLRLFFGHIGEWAANRDGGDSVLHKLILECAHLPRAAMREFKRRALKCQERLDKPIPQSLYRIVNPNRDCAFVFGVMPEGDVAQNEAAAGGAAALAKYACKTGKVVGLFSAPVGEDVVATTPVYLEFPWKHDKMHEEFLAECDPFRPLKSGTLYGYYVKEAESKSS